jgi:hypothetical protein
MWSLTLKEAHKLQGYENKVLRKIYGPKEYEMANIRYYQEGGRRIMLQWIWKWMKLAQDCVQWWALYLVVLYQIGN